MAGNMNRRGRGGMIQRDSKPFSSPGNRIEFRFLIPSKAASIIIGKGGERIQRLRHECNARLSIPDNHGPERVFILESTMDNCIKVWQDCLPDLKDCIFPNTEQRRSSGSFRDDNPDMDLRFLVHDSQVGAIIGKGGVNVKNLRMQYQLNVIKVFPVTAPNSSDRLVQIVGKFEKVFECFRVIYDTLESQSIKGKIENYNSENFDESLTASYGGWGSQYGGGGSGTSADNMRKSGPPFFGANDRNPSQNPRFNNRASEPFFQKPDTNRNNNLPKQPIMNRFDNFNENFNNNSPAFEMEMENFQMPSFSNRLPPMSQEQNVPGLRKRNFMDNEPDNSRRGRMKMNNPNTFENRNEKSSYDNRNEKSSYDNRNEKSSFENRNEKSSFDNRNEKPFNFDNRIEKPNFYDNRIDKINRMDNTVGVSPSNMSIEKLQVSIPTSLIHSVKGQNGEVLSNIISDSGAEISIDGDNEQNMETILNLTGTRDQIDGAQYLLQICIKKSVLNL